VKQEEEKKYNKPKQMQTHKDRNEYTGRDKIVTKTKIHSDAFCFLF